MSIIRNRLRRSSSYLLDTYLATVAYSLRQLKTGVTDVVRVRRSSDNTEKDFTATQITDGTLLAFTGAGDGFVTIWYDQSGNGYNATQTTQANQPKIVDSGVVVTDNGKPAWKLSVTNTAPLVATGLNADLKFSNGVSSFVVGGTPATGGVFYCLGAINTNGVSHFRETTNWKIRSRTTSADANFTATTQQVLLFGNISPTLQQIGANGSAVNSVTSNFLAPLSSASLLLGANNLSGNAASLSSLHQEVIIYNTDQTANRTAIETNINTHYGIY